MKKFNKVVHDFVSLFGGQAYVAYGYDVTTDMGYVNYLRRSSEGHLNFYPFDQVTGLPIVSEHPSTEAEVMGSVWRTVCGVCNAPTVIRKGSSLWLCTGCMGAESIGEFYSVIIRSDWRSVEAVLERRPNAKNRNALTNESLDELIQENKERL